MKNSPEKKNKLTREDFYKIKTNEDLLKIIYQKQIPIDSINKSLAYDKELKELQVELVKLQQWISKKQKQVAIVFEGRDAAGKGGAIRRFAEHLNPRYMRVVALKKPSKFELSQWYFKRYIKELPNLGEIVFFDRSWYNRAIVEPVMKFCTQEQYRKYMIQLPEFEKMLYESGLIVIKLWFSITKDEQLRRFNSRMNNPLKRWKLSKVDCRSQEYWDKYTLYKEKMFEKSNSIYCPWTIVRANDKKKARLESIRYVLSKFDYDGKNHNLTSISPDSNTVKKVLF